MNSAGAQRISRRSSPSRRVRVSGPLVTVAVVLFTAGIICGGVSFADRSPRRVAHVAGTAAWGPHLILLVVAVVLTVVLVARRGAAVLPAPVGARAARRLARTVTAIAHRPAAAVRLLTGLIPIVVMSYLVWRSGLQIIGGLDPDFTANAWGGPTYLGALACHYLDAALLIAVAAGLLNLLLLPDVPRAARTGTS